MIWQSNTVNSDTDIVTPGLWAFLAFSLEMIDGSTSILMGQHDGHEILEEEIEGIFMDDSSYSTYLGLERGVPEQFQR